MTASSKLTAYQATVAGMIQQIRMDETLPLDWLLVSQVMAHVQVESGFDSTVKAADFATTGSVGLMQVEAATAAEIVRRYPAVNPRLPQTDARTSLVTGMLALWEDHQYLLPIYKAPLAYIHVCMAYNLGEGRVGRGELDWPYYYKWLSCQRGFAFLDVPMPALPSSPS